MLDLINAKHDKPEAKKDKQKSWFYRKQIALSLIVALWLISWTPAIRKIQTPANLKWRKINDLYSYYLWYKGRSSEIWNTIEFNPKDIISLLYKKKFKKVADWFDVAQDYYKKVVSKIDFTKSESSNIEEFRIKIRESISDIKANFDRDKFSKDRLWWSTTKLKLFKNLCDNIDDKSLIAYSMTELFPSTDGKLNKEILDFLLRHWWEDFIYSLPAIHDDYASFWPYQFTSFAVYDTGKEKRWASITNDFLKKYSIPWSVTKLRKEDHHKAAYLFAMYNLSRLIDNPENEKALKLISTVEKKNDLAQLIAIMHNKPANWKDFLQERYKLNTNKTYLEKRTYKNKKLIHNYDLNGNKRIDLYESIEYLSTSHSYWKKTYFNRKALDIPK